MKQKVDNACGKRIQTTISKDLMEKIETIVWHNSYIFGYVHKSDLVRNAIKYYVDNIVEIEREKLIEQFEHLQSQGMIKESNFYDYMKGIMNEMNENEYLHKLGIL